MLELQVRQADSNEISLDTLSKKPLLDTLLSFWHGSEAEFIEYLESIGIHYTKDYGNNFYTFTKIINEDLEKIHKAFFNENIGKLDFRIVNLITPKNLPSFSDKEYIKLSFDLSSLSDIGKKDAIKNIFFKHELASNSLIDFKSLQNDICELYYHRQGFYEREGNLRLLRSRVMISMLESFLDPKDNNFICSQFLLKFASLLQEEQGGLELESFYHTYRLNGGVQKSKTCSLEETLKWGSYTEEEKKVYREALREAKNEIKQEVNLNRTSLPSESNESQILKEKPQIKITSPLDLPKDKEKNRESDELEAIVQNSFEAYRLKEREKLEIRLDKSAKDSKEAYKELKEALYKGSSLVDALRVLSQKYRNEDTLNFASLLLAKDILDIKSRDAQIEDLKKEKEELKQEIESINQALDSSSQTISKLKATISNMTNESNLLKEQTQEQIESLQKQTQEMIKKYQEEIEENNGVVEEQNAIILELEKENATLKKQAETTKDLGHQYEILKLQSSNEFNLLKEQSSNEINLLKERLGFTETTNKGLEDKIKNLETQLKDLLAKFSNQGHKETNTPQVTNDSNNAENPQDKSQDTTDTNNSNNSTTSHYPPRSSEIFGIEKR